MVGTHFNQDPMVTQYARWLMRWRWLVILATLVVVGFRASGIRFLESTTG
jgi:hypothetical protein